MSASSDPGTSSRSPSFPQMQSRRGVAIVLLAVVIWSTTPVFIDHLQTVDRLSPLQVSTWRVLLVTLLLALYLLVRRPRVLKLQRHEIGYYVIYGVVGIGLFNLAFNTSVAVNKASVATALMFCAPVFVALGSWWVFHERERLPARSVQRAMLCALHALRARSSARKPGKPDRDSLLYLPVRHACPGPVGLHN